jgi:hypothetical protein
MGDAMGGSASASRTHAAKVKELTGCVAGKLCGNGCKDKDGRKQPRRLIKDRKVVTSKRQVEGVEVVEIISFTCSDCSQRCCKDQAVCVDAMYVHVKTHTRDTLPLSERDGVSQFFVSYFGGLGHAKTNVKLLLDVRQGDRDSGSRKWATFCAALANDTQKDIHSGTVRMSDHKKKATRCGHETHTH